MRRNCFVGLLFLLLIFGMAGGVSAKDWPSQTNVDSQKIWTIKFNGEVDPITVTSSNVYIDGVTTTIALGPDKKSITVSPPNAGYQPGQTYYLHINTLVKNKDGKALQEEHIKPFTVKWITTPQELQSYLSHKYSHCYINGYDLDFNILAGTYPESPGGLIIGLQETSPESQLSLAIIANPSGYANWIMALAGDIDAVMNGQPMVGAIRTCTTIIGAFDNWLGYPRLLSTDQPPATPTGFTVTATKGQFILTWDANTETDLQGYYLKYKSDINGEWILAVSNMGSSILPDTSTSYTLTGVPDDTTGYFCLIAVDKAGNESQPTEILSATTPKSTGYVIITPMKLWSDDGMNVYLGKVVSDEYDVEGIFNTYSLYGSQYRVNSIWNEFGTYGSPYSMYSAFNTYATNPPIIKDSAGIIVGRLTTNKYITGAVSPIGLQQSLKIMGY